MYSLCFVMNRQMKHKFKPEAKNCILLPPHITIGDQPPLAGQVTSDNNP